MDIQHEIKLQKLKRRRYQVLQEHAAYNGPGHTPPGVVLELESLKTELHETDSMLTRYKKLLKEQQAKSGYNTDPKVIIDIEDIEEYLRTI